MSLSLRRLLIHWRFRLGALPARFCRLHSGAYHRRLSAELEHYQRELARAGEEALFEAAPPVWHEIERRAAQLIRERAGYAPLDYVIARLAQLPRSRMLSLGCGAGGLELEVASQVPQAEILALDVNPELLERGQQAAHKRGLRNVRFERVDLNCAQLPPRAFDVVFCHAVLHHLVELEHVAQQIRRALRPEGELVIVEIVTRNGYRMWPETRRVARALFCTLPERYRLNHTAYYPHKRVDRKLWEWDTRAAGMECIRSQDILPVLGRVFHPVLIVPYYAFARRFFDSMYGPNYDLKRGLDRAIVDWLWELDRYYLETGRLRGETVFAVFR